MAYIGQRQIEGGLSLFHKRYPDVGIELNVKRHPYSFGLGSGRMNLPGPGKWKYYDGLAGYSQTQLSSEFNAVHSSADLRSAIAGTDLSLTQLLPALAAAWKDAGGSSIDELLHQMEEAEANGRVGRTAFGSKLRALDCAFGNLRVEKFKAMGRAVEPPINFDMDVDFEWQPVDSQRLVLWASLVGKQEEVASALWKLHFEKRASLTQRSTLLLAAGEVGLDHDACEHFLNSGEMIQDVIDGYKLATAKHRIHWPPFFVLNGPSTNGGPFRNGSWSASIVRGPPEAFAEAFEQIWKWHNHSNWNWRTWWQEWDTWNSEQDDDRCRWNQDRWHRGWQKWKSRVAQEDDDLWYSR